MPNKIKIQILIDDQPIVYNEVATTETFDPFLCKTLAQGLLAQMSSNVGALEEDLGLENMGKEHNKKILPYEQSVSLYETDIVMDKIAEAVGTSVITLGNFKAIVDAEMDLVALVPPRIADAIVDLLNNISKYKDD